MHDADEYEWEPSMDPDFDMYDELVDLHGVTHRKAETLSEEYPNLPTLSWAAWHDEEYLQDEVKINPGFLRDQLDDADLYASYQHFPERVIRPDRGSADETAVEALLPASQQRLSDYREEDAGDS